MSGAVGTVRRSETEEVTDLQNRLYTLERKRSAGEKCFSSFHMYTVATADMM